MVGMAKVITISGGSFQGSRISTGRVCESCECSPSVLSGLRLEVWFIFLTRCFRLEVWFSFDRTNG